MIKMGIKFIAVFILLTCYGSLAAFSENLRSTVDDVLTNPKYHHPKDRWAKLKVHGKDILPYLRPYIVSYKTEERRSAQSMLLYIGPIQESLEYWGLWVNDSDRYVRERAQEYLFANFQPEIIVRKLPLLYEDIISVEKIKKFPTGNAVLLLGQYKNRKAYDYLIKLRNERPSSVRYASVATVGAVPYDVVVDVALANHGYDTAIRQVRDYLISDEPDPRILKFFLRAILYMNLDLFKNEIVACLDDITEVEGVTSSSHYKVRVCDFAVDALRFKFIDPDRKSHLKAKAIPVTYRRYTENEINELRQKIK